MNKASAVFFITVMSLTIVTMFAAGIYAESQGIVRKGECVKVPKLVEVCK